ncbi:MAG: TolC family protein [bacterium]|nr:TolC family protein [bacterium]
MKVEIMNRINIRMFFLILTALLISGCAGQVATHEEAVESIRNQDGQDKIPKSWSAAESTGLVDDGWLKTFNDEKLVNLVNEALQKNPGLKISEAQVERANALARQAGAALKPTVGLAGGYSDRNSEALSDLYGSGLQISWEADVWGRIRSGVAGAEEIAAATASDYEYARQSLAAATSRAWFLAVASKLQHQYALEAVGILKETARLVTVKEKVGQVSMKDVHLAKGNLASAQEAERKARTAMENAQRGLELLLGRYPSADIKTADRLVSVPPSMPSGIPSQILERRPDLISAEQQVAAAFYKQKAAELLHLPRFSFSIGAGITNLDNAISNLSAGIFAPLYTGGAIEAEVEAATADQKKAIANYAQKALQAFKEVETALAGEQYLQDREGYLEAVVTEDFKAYELTRKQFEVGKIDFLDVLIVQNKWLAARIVRLDVSMQRLINRVFLHQALGGSFQ